MLAEITGYTVISKGSLNFAIIVCNLLSIDFFFYLFRDYFSSQKLTLHLRIILAMKYAQS